VGRYLALRRRLRRLAAAWPEAGCEPAAAHGAAPLPSEYVSALLKQCT